MRLVAFDFDGTLCDDEMIVRLGEQAGCEDEILAITERAMAGELGYAESLRRRIALLEGLPVSKMRVAFDHIRLRQSAATLLRSLTGRQVRTAILTGGFEEGVRLALERDDAVVDDIVANTLVVRENRLTGVVEGPLVDDAKDGALRTLAERYGIDMRETIAVGDGANDVPMLEAAGTAIGFQPKPSVPGSCDIVVDSMAELRTALEQMGG